MTRSAPPDDQALLSLCDDVRSSLQEKKELGQKRNELMQVLGAAVKSECDGVPTITIQTIRITRIDKLLSEMLKTEYNPDVMTMKLRADLSIAESLERQWRARFKERYFTLDHYRYQKLTTIGGRLEDLVFNEAFQNTNELWLANQSGSLSEGEGNARFKDGQ